MKMKFDNVTQKKQLQTAAALWEAYAFLDQCERELCFLCNHIIARKFWFHRGNFFVFYQSVL